MIQHVKKHYNQSRLFVGVHSSWKHNLQSPVYFKVDFETCTLHMYSYLEFHTCNLSDAVFIRGCLLSEKIQLVKAVKLVNTQVLDFKQASNFY